MTRNQRKIFSSNILSKISSFDSNEQSVAMKISDVIDKYNDETEDDYSSKNILITNLKTFYNSVMELVSNFKYTYDESSLEWKFMTIDDNINLSKYIISCSDINYVTDLPELFTIFYEASLSEDRTTYDNIINTEGLFTGDNAEKKSYVYDLTSLDYKDLLKENTEENPDCLLTYLQNIIDYVFTEGDIKELSNVSKLLTSPITFLKSDMSYNEDDNYIVDDYSPYTNYHNYYYKLCEVRNTLSYKRSINSNYPKTIGYINTLEDYIESSDSSDGSDSSDEEIIDISEDVLNRVETTVALTNLKEQSSSLVSLNNALLTYISEGIYAMTAESKVQCIELLNTLTKYLELSEFNNLVKICNGLVKFINVRKTILLEYVTDYTISDNIYNILNSRMNKMDGTLFNWYNDSCSIDTIYRKNEKDKTSCNSMFSKLAVIKVKEDPDGSNYLECESGISKYYKEILGTSPSLKAGDTVYIMDDSKTELETIIKSISYVTVQGYDSSITDSSDTSSLTDMTEQHMVIEFNNSIDKSYSVDSNLRVVKVL